MELYEDRVINGVLKSDLVSNPEEASALLAQDVEIISSAERARRDLWPCIWALASALQRQFKGRIFVRCGLLAPLHQPIRLAGRCHFVSAPTGAALKVWVGLKPDSSGLPNVWGDARGARISHRSLIDSVEAADPISCYALAGYLGFATLATAVRIPAFREDLCIRELELPFAYDTAWSLPHDGLALLGLGQLGQAYLSLLYFLAVSRGDTPIVALLDKDRFERPNYSTQILLEEGDDWLNAYKAEYLTAKAEGWGWRAESEISELTWNWKRPVRHPDLAMLGFDDLDVRRMAFAAGYSWLVDAGVGTSFLTPRLSWHSLPPDPVLARHVFGGDRVKDPKPVRENTAFVQQLKESPGGCGWVAFQNIRATAPSLGLVAAAYAWSEMVQILAGQRKATEGRACIWSPLLPFSRVPRS